MEPFALHLAAVSLAACALTAQAEPVTISAGGTFTLAAFGSAPTAARLQFAMDSVVVNPGVQPAAFLVYDQTVQFTFGNVTTAITRNEMGWFDDLNSNYAGIDFRLLDVLTPGDMLQFIWSPGLVFSGPLTAPTLDLVTLGPIGGLACYYVARFGACEASYFNDGHYSVTAANSVPVPTTLALLPLALGLAVGATRRRKA
jgi:hypothetical protein